MKLPTTIASSASASARQRAHIRQGAAHVNEAIDRRWAASVIDDKIRKNALALELAWLDKLQETFYARVTESVPLPKLRLSSAQVGLRLQRNRRVRHPTTGDLWSVRCSCSLRAMILEETMREFLLASLTALVLAVSPIALAEHGGGGGCF